MPSMRWRRKGTVTQEMKNLNYSNSEIEKVIDDFVHSQRDRAILKRRYIDGILIEPLSEEFDLSPRQIRNIIYKNENLIFSHIGTAIMD